MVCVLGMCIWFSICFVLIIVFLWLVFWCRWIDLVICLFIVNIGFSDVIGFWNIIVIFVLWIWCICVVFCLLSLIILWLCCCNSILLYCIKLFVCFNRCINVNVVIDLLELDLLIIVSVLLCCRLKERLWIAVIFCWFCIKVIFRFLIVSILLVLSLLLCGNGVFFFMVDIGGWCIVCVVLGVIYFFGVKW